MTEPPCKGRSCRKNLKTWDSLCPASKGPARFQETPGTPTERWEGQPLPVRGLLETVHQLTQVVASIAKSCPEHLPIFLFSLGDFALRILARSTRADFNSFSKRSHHVTRGISSSLGSFGIGTVQGCTRGFGGEELEHETADASGGTPPVRCSRLSHAG